MTRVAEQFDDIADFERLLGDAAAQAKSEWEQDFVGDMNARYEQYGAEMFLSDRQRGQLERMVEK